MDPVIYPSNLNTTSRGPKRDQRKQSRGKIARQRTLSAANSSPRYAASLNATEVRPARRAKSIKREDGLPGPLPVAAELDDRALRYSTEQWNHTFDARTRKVECEDIVTPPYQYLHPCYTATVPIKVEEDVEADDELFGMGLYEDRPYSKVASAATSRGESYHTNAISLSPPLSTNGLLLGEAFRPLAEDAGYDPQNDVGYLHDGYAYSHTPDAIYETGYSLDDSPFSISPQSEHYGDWQVLSAPGLPHDPIEMVGPDDDGGRHAIFAGLSDVLQPYWINAYGRTHPTLNVPVGHWVSAAGYCYHGMP